jgi:adenine-specific DNA-methyltransferase
MADHKMNALKEKIANAIAGFAHSDVKISSENLLNLLGYHSTKKATITIESLKDRAARREMQMVKYANWDEWKRAELIFQLTSDEIQQGGSLFDFNVLQEDLIQSYLFFTIELQKSEYTRGTLSQITRFLNRLYDMPAMILFRYGKNLTLSVINRRLHKTDGSKDVLRKVTLIKDINLEKPHRAHKDILFDLSLGELRRKHTITNFQDLHNAWQKTLDTKELNKQFYQKLFNWYLWALREVRFPQMRNEKDMVDDKVHQSESLIRLLTRLLFVWFMKEKGLITSGLFNPEFLNQILRNFGGNNGNETIFYKAILQNLFFATLNQPIEKRKILGKGFNPAEYGDPLVYRFDDLFVQPEKMPEYFKDIPFLNGGLFECLDQKKDSENAIEIRLDGFSTKKSKQVHLPDKYFFGEYSGIDLSTEYDDTKKRSITVNGIIDILSAYKFTIEESTPVEEEIALDPELLGKVFENLLASYNPETQTTARKQTGSFYTPREIVNYMVDESLIQHLKNAVDDEDRLRKLFSFEENAEAKLFDANETKALIMAIDDCKILDPACGSGAFPMGALQKITHILHKLDPENKIWFDMVIGNLPSYMQAEARKKLEKENWNYVRKLGIVQQCLYGVDIQPIAVQIAKLRFFISLLVDQQAKPGEPNMGYEPLPNLDFKLVAANTLIGAPANIAIEAYAKDALPNFERLTNEYFSAVDERKQEIKEEIRKNVKVIVAANQRAINMWIDKSTRERNTATAARKKQMEKQLQQFEQDLTYWNSFPNIYKNESVAFFETSYFFPQVKEGFDVVIGNPPYVEAKKLKDVSQILRKYYTTYSGTADLYVYFYENGIRLLRPNGNLVFITSNKFVKTSYGENLRKYLISIKINEIIDFTDVHVFEALVASCIFSLRKEKVIGNEITIAFANDSLTDFGDLLSFVEKNKFMLLQDNLTEKIWQLEDETKLSLKRKIEEGSVTILQTGSISVYRGVTTGYNPAFIIDAEKREELIRADRANSRIIKPMLQGRNIRKWIYNSSFEYLLQTGFNISIDKEYPIIYNHLCLFKDQLEIRADQGLNWWNLRSCKYYSEFEKEKIIWGLTSDKWTFAYDNAGNYLPSNGYILTSKQIPIKFLIALLNSKLMEFYFSFIGIMTAGGAYTLKYETVVEFPIKLIANENQLPFITLVDQILSAKTADPTADTTALENRIDELVYKLYDLTYEEVKVIDPEFWMSEGEYNSIKLKE